MRRIFLVLLLSTLGAYAHGQGMLFFEGSYDEALAKAKAENKKVFIDFYADWCMPCKEMSKNVFTDSLVGRYLNEHFVNVKLDAEAPENAGAVKRYKVTSMPTLVFTDASGKSILLKVGAMNAADFLRDAKIATGEELGFEELYGKLKSSPNDFALIQKILREAPAFVGAQEGVEAEKWIVRINKLYNSYIEKKMGPELINKTDFAIISTFHKFGTKDDKLAEFINANLPAFMKELGNGPAITVIEHNNKIIEALACAGKEDYLKYLDRIKGDMQLAYSVMPVRKLSAYERSKCYYDAMYQLYYKKNAREYARLMNQYLDIMGEDASPVDYGGAAQNMYNATRGKVSDDMHRQAVEWITKALQFNEIDAINKINLLVMLGDSYTALKEIEKAKECYNQGFIISLQMDDGYMKARIQMVVKQKLASLELE